MKINYYQDLINQPKKKIKYYLDYKRLGGKVLFIFDHGLGDYVMFLDLFETIRKKYPKWDFKIGSHPSLKLSGFHPNEFDLSDYLNPIFVLPIGMSIVQQQNALVRYNVDKLQEEFDYIFVIQYHDFNLNQQKWFGGKVVNNLFKGRSKNYICKTLEFGFDDDFPIEKYQINYKNKKIDPKKISFHFNANTDKARKTPSLDIQEKIWKDLESMGYEPFDVNINSRLTIGDSPKPLPDFIPEERSIRNITEGGPSLLLDHIVSSKFFIGLVSGPLVLASNVIGGERCVSIEKNTNIKDYIPNENFNILNISNGYEPDKLEEIIHYMENNISNGNQVNNER